MLSKIKDRYTFRIEREIAKGGMGTVYQATQLGAYGFEKTVAIKTLLPEFSENKQFLNMFIGEGKLVADLVHENIVQIYQLGTCKVGCYILMEYVCGISLHDFIRFHQLAEKQIPTELAVFIASRIMRGLAFAHSRLSREGHALNIVHRDVCPNNVLITTEGLPKVGDFGIAKAANNIMPLHDRSLMGKLYYMSPEQAQRQPADHRSDIYSLGLVLFEMLALERARGPWKTNLLEAASKGQVNWDALPDDINDDLRRIVGTMLEKDRDKRYHGSDKVAYELEYHIYRKGYGPTVVTLENYLRENMAYLYTQLNVPTKQAEEDTLVPTLRMQNE